LKKFQIDAANRLGVVLMLLGALAAVLLAWGASRQPSPGFEIKRILEPSLVQQSQIGLPVVKLNKPIDGIEVGMTVTAITSGAVHLGVTASVVLRESPEPLQQFALLRQFHATDQLLHDMQGAPIMFTFSDGSRVARVLQPRGLASLGSYFWVPLLSGLFTYSLGCALLLVARREPVVWVYFGAITSYAITAFSRAWYGDRQWGLATWMWELCSFATRTGAIGILALGVVFVWNIPRPLGSQRTPWLIAAGMATVCLLDLARIIEPRSITYHWPLIVYLSILLSIGFLNWKKGGMDLPEQAAARWFLLLTGICLAVIAVKLVGLVFGYVLPHYGQIITAITVLPYLAASAFLVKGQIFKLETWWWRIWFWLFGGVLVILLDFLLVGLLGASQSTGLAVALALSGWLYFPLRQWVLGKLSLRSRLHLEDHVASLLELSALRAGSLEAGKHWQAILDRVFEPQSITAHAQPRSEPAISAQGVQLLLPDLAGQMLQLTAAGRGTRLFNTDDLHFAQTLTRLAEHASQFERTYHEGAAQERKRIAADLHDDIGGKLLHLANQSGSDGQYARNALEDLRTLTRGLSGQTRTLENLFADLQYQLAQRADRQSVAFDWQCDLGGAAQEGVGARQATVLASICSELLRNALQHGSVSNVQFRFFIREGSFHMACTSDGEHTNPQQWTAGLGTTSIKRRVHDLQGQCSWAGQSTGGIVFEAHWSVAVWLQGDTGAFFAQTAP
jgi:signal transduction histidine kinase